MKCDIITVALSVLYQRLYRPVQISLTECKLHKVVKWRLVRVKKLN